LTTTVYSVVLLILVCCQ